MNLHIPCCRLVVTGAFFLSAVSSALAIQSMELVPDRNYIRGFSVKHPDTGDVQGTIRWDDSNSQSPLWEISQWESHSSLWGLNRTDISEGSIVAKKWQSIHKVFCAGKWNHSKGRISKTVNSNTEYGSVFRDGSVKDWPHLLCSARISGPGGWRESNAPYVSQMTNLNYTFKGQLTYANNNHTVDSEGNGYDSLIHAAQLVVFFTVQNLYKNASGVKHADYGNYLWFGIAAYDDRYPNLTLNIKGDGGTGKMIYNIGINSLVSNVSFHDGQYHEISGDLLPFVDDAIEYAYDAGKLVSDDPAHYKIGGMNFGWEVPGLSVVTFKTRDISLVAKYN